MIAFCEDCYSRISQEGKIPLYVLVRCCTAYSEDKFLSCDYARTPFLCATVTHLEHLGLVVTTEISISEYAFIPNGQPYINRLGMYEYCWCCL